MRKCFHIWAILMLLPAILLAQDQPFAATPLGIIYNSERVFDARLQTSGWSVGVSRGIVKSYYKTPFYYFGIGELRHNKETRSNYDLGGSATPARPNRPYVLGKQNNLFVLRLGYGVKRYWSEKTSDRGVAVATVFQAGLTMGLLKPYYVYLRRLDDGNYGYISSLERYSKENASDFVDPYSIQGSGGFWEGLSEIKPAPALHLRGGVHVDAGAFDQFVRAAEVGLSVEIFPNRVPILVTTQNQSVFANLYLSLQLGKRY